MKLILATILLLGLQGLPPLVGPLVPNSTGTVTGFVRRSGTGQPIENTRVAVVSRAERLAQANLGTAMSAVTDFNGKFTIKGVNPGLYVLVAESEGYFSLNGETSASTRATKDIAVNEGQQTDAGTLELIPGAAISGRIAGPDGQPLTGAVVQIFQASYVRDRLVFTPTKTARTDDLGEYRLYWLSPGEYYVRAQYRGTGDRTERYGRVFFPGITDEDAAPPVMVGAGAEVSGIDIRVPLTALTGFKISGRVVSPVDPESVRVSSVRVVPRDQRVLVLDEADAFPNQVIDASSGQFEIRNVTPGAYNIYPTTRDIDGNMRSMPIPVDVVNRDISNLSAVLEPAIDVVGRITLDDRKPGDRVLNGSIALVPTDDWPGVSNPVRINPDPESGEFTLSHLPPGKYVFQSASFRDPDVYVADAKMGQDTIYDRGFIVAGESREPIDVTLKSQGGVVSGVILDSSRLRPQLYSTVVLVPDAARRQNLDLYKQTTSANGSFTFRGIPPGDYKVFAWASVTPGAWLNPAFLQKFEDRGLSVTVAAGAEKSVQPTVIP